MEIGLYFGKDLASISVNIDVFAIVFKSLLMIFTRYGVDEPKISHNLVQFAANLPDSFDPVAKRKLFLSLKISCVVLIHDLRLS